MSSDVYPMIAIPAGTVQKIEAIDTLLAHVQQDLDKVFYEGRKVRVYLGSNQRSPTDAVVLGVNLSLIGRERVHVELRCRCDTASRAIRFVSLRNVRDDTRKVVVP